MIIEKITNDVKNFLKEKQPEKVILLRSLLSAIKNEEILKKKKEEGLNEQEVVAVLKREVKKRQEAGEQFKIAGRDELANKEQEELAIIKVYLPEEMGEQEVKKIVEQVLEEMGEVAPSQFGQVMGAVMAKVKGQADGVLVSKLVKEALN